MDRRIFALQAALPALSDSDQTFAASLIAQAQRRGLSDKQFFWVEKLTARAAPAAAEPPKASLGDMSGLAALFDHAIAKGIKFPKIRLDVNGQPITLARCGEGSRYTGDINVTGGKGDGKLWHGRVARANGEWTPSRRDPAPEGLLPMLAELARDPSAAGAAHGQRTGNCCFCGRDLMDYRSVDAGYGPICAENWGLAWGDKKEERKAA